MTTDLIKRLTEAGEGFKTMRGPLDLGDFPYRLRFALEKFDAIRSNLRDSNEDYDDAEPMASLHTVGPDLRRLKRGLERLTDAGLLRIARQHSGVCKVYMRQRGDTFRTLNGLFYWNDGKGETRRRVLLLAWKKGARNSESTGGQGCGAPGHPNCLSQRRSFRRDQDSAAAMTAQQEG